MQTVLIVIHLMVVLALVGVVLIQRSEGGGLGIGGGSGFMSARGTANALTRTTAILATLFFVTSMAIGILSRYESKPTDILDQIPASQTTTGKGILDALPGTKQPAAPVAPKDNGVPGASEPAAMAPAAPATPAPDAMAPATPAANEPNAMAPAAPAAETPSVPADAMKPADTAVPSTTK
jgi:preprotein translocase subunit SecG